MKRAGFTLVEILVVIVIIGIIMAFLIPNALRATTVANTKQCASNIRAIQAAVQMCMAEHRDGTATWCGSQDNLLPYMQNNAWPTCPLGGSAYSITASSQTGIPPTLNETDHFAVGDFPDLHVAASGG